MTEDVSVWVDTSDKVIVLRLPKGEVEVTYEQAEKLEELLKSVFADNFYKMSKG